MKKKMTKVFSAFEPASRVEVRCDKLGTTKDGLEVLAATDAAGPQVIVEGSKVHLLSRPLKNHEAAIKLGKQVVKNGIRVYKDWFDIRKSDAIGLFAIFGGEFRG